MLPPGEEVEHDGAVRERPHHATIAARDATDDGRQLGRRLGPGNIVECIERTANSTERFGPAVFGEEPFGDLDQAQRELLALVRRVGPTDHAVPTHDRRPRPGVGGWKSRSASPSSNPGRFHASQPISPR